MLYILFSIFLAGAILTWVADKISGILRDLLFLLTVLSATTFFYLKIPVGYTTNITLAGLHLQWGITAFGWYFSLIVLGLGTMAAFYALSYMKGRTTGIFLFQFSYQSALHDGHPDES